METARQMAREQNDKMAAIISVHWLYGSSKHIYTPVLDFCKECTLRTQEKVNISELAVTVTAHQVTGIRERERDKTKLTGTHSFSMRIGDLRRHKRLRPL